MNQQTLPPQPGMMNMINPYAPPPPVLPPQPAYLFLLSFNYMFAVFFLLFIFSNLILFGFLYFLIMKISSITGECTNRSISVTNKASRNASPQRTALHSHLSCPSQTPSFSPSS